MQFLQWHVMLSITLHTTSLWLAVAMAFIRRMTLRVTRLNSSWQRPTFAWKLCIAIYIVVAVLCIPSLFVHEIDVYKEVMWEPSLQCASLYPPNYTEPIYTFTVSKAATANNCSIFKLNIWMIGLVFKVIPCILLYVIQRRSGLIRFVKREATSTELKMSANEQCEIVLRQPIRPGPKPSNNECGCDLAVFLITELPQGIISILYLYYYLGDILDLLSLLNSSVNFVLYCVMSSRYRQTFWLVFLPSGAQSLCITKQTTTASNFNFTQLQLQRKNSNKVRNKNTLLATECRRASRRSECGSASNLDSQNTVRNSSAPVRTLLNLMVVSENHCPAHSIIVDS
ncbi:hypothetical protein OSTOST_01871 [Ostertagia ostertagi]